MNALAWEMRQKQVIGLVFTNGDGCAEDHRRRRGPPLRLPLTQEAGSGRAFNSGPCALFNGERHSSKSTSLFSRESR